MDDFEQILAAEEAKVAEGRSAQVDEWDVTVKAVTQPGLIVTAPANAVPCDCLAYDDQDNAHTVREHTSCGGQLCGGCDDCISTQVRYWNRQEMLARIPGEESHQS